MVKLALRSCSRSTAAGRTLGGGEWRCTAQGALRMYTAGGRGHARKRQKARAGGRVARHDGCLVPGPQKGNHACLAWEVIASPAVRE